MAESDGNWLTLSEASEALGVHPSTLRRWADSGRVPCQRTPGGHRRFGRKDLAEWSGGHRNDAGEPPLADERRWFAVYEGSGRSDEMRVLGQRLSGVAVQHLLGRGEDPRCLEEALGLGVDYGRSARASGVCLREAAGALARFRVGLAQVVAQMVTAENQSAARLLALHEELMSQVLLGLLEGYES